MSFETSKYPRYGTKLGSSCPTMACPFVYDYLTLVVTTCTPLRGNEFLCLVDHVHCDLTELVTVLAGVVGAEEQLTATELHSHVCLCTAAVTPVGGRESSGLGLDDCCAHESTVPSCLACDH